MQNDGNKSTHLLRARAVQSRHAPLRNEPGLLTTLVPEGTKEGFSNGEVKRRPPLITLLWFPPMVRNHSARLLRAGAVKPRRAPPRNAIGQLNTLVMTQRTCWQQGLLSLGALCSGARSGYPAHWSRPSALAESSGC